MNGKPHGHPIHCGNSAFATRTVHLSNKGLSDPHVQDSASSGTEKCGQDFHAEERSMSVDWGPKIPRALRRYDSPESGAITARPRRTVYPVSPTGPPLSALGDAEVDDGTEHQHNKARNRLRSMVFMVSPAGFEPATTGIRRTVLRGQRCLPDALQSLYINGLGVSEHLRCRSPTTRSMASW